MKLNKCGDDISFGCAPLELADTAGLVVGDETREFLMKHLQDEIDPASITVSLRHVVSVHGIKKEFTYDALIRSATTNRYDPLVGLAPIAALNMCCYRPDGLKDFLHDRGNSIFIALDPKWKAFLKLFRNDRRQIELQTIYTKSRPVIAEFSLFAFTIPTEAD